MKGSSTAFLYFLSGVLAALPLAADAYEIATHRAMSAIAFRSTNWVADGSGPASLGLVNFPNATYLGSTGSMIPRELVEHGAQHQDDGGRPLHHFFDPVRGTSGIPIPFAQSSPDWILDAGIVPGYTYPDALAYFRSSLLDATPDLRSASWGALFETLGHVIHHIQDMAQPQHVRGDSHFHRDWPLVGDRSLYEFCTEAAVIRPTDPSKCGQPLDAPTYPAVHLPLARDYWSTRRVDPYGRARGMADFTNANFVSKDTNFRLIDDRLVLRAEQYSKPVPVGFQTLTLEELGAADVCERLRRDPRTFGRAASCEIEFFATEVHDAYASVTAINERASSLSVFDQYLELRPDGPTYRTDRLFTLNRYNYAAAHPFLISRAIGYSAGLIDHFFRGRLELATAENDNGLLRIEVKNISAEGNAFGPGTFTLYYDSASGQRKPLTIESGADLGMQQFAPGQTHVLTARAPADVDLNAEKAFVVAYAGTVGAEDAVSGLVFEAPQIYEGFRFRANGPLVDRAGGGRLIYLADGQWHLHPQGELPSVGNIDWKGWYMEGKATRSLTWGGPSRYDADMPERYGTTIYQHGKPLAVTPGTVLGAALQRDADGSPWIVAICAIGDRDVAFRRPAMRSSSAALFDAQTAPDGWRYLGEFQSPPDLKPRRRPWLFNGEGTEAQTMRERKTGSVDIPEPLARLKASVGRDVAQFFEVPNSEVTQVFRGPHGRCDPMDVSWQLQATGEHVIAVDYTDEGEIVAKLVVDSLVESRKQATIGEETRGIDTFAEDTQWTVELGGTEFTLYAKHSAGRTAYSAGTSGNSPDYTWDASGEGEETRAHLLFWDLRNGGLISATGRVDHVSTSHLEEDDRNVKSTGARRAYFVRQLVHSGQPASEINRTPLVEQPTNVTAEMVPGVGEWISRNTEGCRSPDTEPPLTATEVSSELTATLATLPGVGYPPNMEVFSLAAGGTDRNGNFFWSLRYSDGPRQPFRRISRIGSLNVDALTGLGAADAFIPPYTDIVPN